MERPDHTASEVDADVPEFTALWNTHRRRMLDLAFRMLLDLGDAEDVVQEAFARLARADIAGIDDPEAWLVVVTSRLCLDKLRARQRRPTDALDTVARRPCCTCPSAIESASSPCASIESSRSSC